MQFSVDSWLQLEVTDAQKQMSYNYLNYILFSCIIVSFNYAAKHIKSPILKSIEEIPFWVENNEINYLYEHLVLSITDGVSWRNW